MDDDFVADFHVRDFVADGVDDAGSIAAADVEAGVVALLGMRVIPTVIEYTTIQKAVARIASEGLSTVPEIRNAFDRQRDIEFSIQAISGKDLDITKENDKVVIGFAYNKEVESSGRTLSGPSTGGTARRRASTSA